MNTFTDTIMMIRPAHFGYNVDTAQDNSFQTVADQDNTQISLQARKEFDAMVDLLRANDLEVIVYEDLKDQILPDAVFPNNWISTHLNSSIATYAMKAESRRVERREDIVNDLTTKFNFAKRYGFEYNEEDGLFLEGTGSMVLDRENRICYAGLSDRTEISVLEKFAVLYNYKKIIFHTQDQTGIPIYHTNVVMTVTDDFVIICLAAITDDAEKKELIETIKDTNKQILEITTDQMYHFAGNMIQLKSKLGQKLIILSDIAHKSLTAKQIDLLRTQNKLIPIKIPTIEKYGGGSVRCMIAEVFTSKK